MHARVEISLDSLRSIERNVVPVHLDIHFGLNLSEDMFDEVMIGFQFPFRIVSYENLQVVRLPEKAPVSITEDELLVLERTGEDKTSKTDTSVFYVKFSPSLDLALDFVLSIDLRWEGALHCDSFSSFTQTFPVAVSAASAHRLVYDSCPAASLYYGQNIDLLMDIHFLWDFEIRGGSHPTQALAETEAQTRPPRLQPSLTYMPYEEYRSVIEVIMIEFAIPELSEQRDRLLYDSGLYMGLGVGLLFSGIHEALKVSGELGKRQREKWRQ